jgi:hypothetical protein
MNAQVTRIFSDTFEIYIGGENIEITNRKMLYWAMKTHLDLLLMRQ